MNDQVECVWQFSTRRANTSFGILRYESRYASTSLGLHINSSGFDAVAIMVWKVSEKIGSS